MEGVGGINSAALKMDGRNYYALPLNKNPFKYYLDKSTPHVRYRWIGTTVLALVYALRIYLLQGFYIVTYLLGVYIVHLLVHFLKPPVDPEIKPSDGPLLPTKGSDEFKPFIHHRPEFKFWFAITKAFCATFIITFFSRFDFHASWLLLFLFWIILFFYQMLVSIARLIRYKHIPFNPANQKVIWKRSSGSGCSTRD